VARIVISAAGSAPPETRSTSIWNDTNAGSVALAIESKSVPCGDDTNS
jgi:hypothetical protein